MGDSCKNCLHCNVCRHTEGIMYLPSGEKITDTFFDYLEKIGTCKSYINNLKTERMNFDVTPIISKQNNWLVLDLESPQLGEAIRSIFEAVKKYKGE